MDLKIVPSTLVNFNTGNEIVASPNLNTLESFAGNANEGIKHSEAKKNNLVSFDIFDTLLIRGTCLPEAVFYFVGKTAHSEGLIACSPERYVKLRKEAEQRSRIDQVGGEVNDKRIFEFIIILLGTNSDVGERLRELEIFWEYKLIKPVPFALDLVNQEREAGNQIAFVSDMYWSSDVIKGLLIKHKFWNDNDQLWVSAEHQASKTNSELFKKVLAFNQIKKASDVKHYGNNYEADLKGAKRVGIVPVFLPSGNANKRELLLEQYTYSSGGISSLLSGAGRLLRLQYANEEFKKAELARIVGNVVGPSFTLYVLWIIRKSRAEGIKKLFFISRDGYVPYIIAEKIINNIAPEIKISYIYGSRQAWHIAGLETFNEETFGWLFDHTDGATAVSVLMRAGVSWEDFSAIFPAISEKISNPFADITREQMEYIKSIILSNPSLQHLILNEARRRKSLLAKYLKQECFVPGEKAGMIEIGWSGRTRKSFERAIGAENAAHLHWFYLGLHKNIFIPETHRVHYFLFGPHLNYPFIQDLAVVAESFCMATHGSLLGFEEIDGIVVPFFKEKIEESYEQWGRAFYLSAIQAYCDLLPIADIQVEPGNDLRGPAYHILQHFSENPQKEDGQVFGSLPFEHDQFGTVTYTLSPKLKLNHHAISEALKFGTYAKTAAAGQLGAWGSGTWVAGGYGAPVLKIFTFFGYLRVNKWKILKSIGSETKSYMKKILEILAVKKLN